MSAADPGPNPVSSPEAKPKKTPYDAIKDIPGAPSPEMLEAMRQSTPNQRIRLFSPDMKRFFILRGIGGLELQQLQANLPASTPEKTAQAEQNRVVAQCTLWTNITKDNKLNEQSLVLGSAGLPSTLYNLITVLSDFVDPQAFDELSAEL